MAASLSKSDLRRLVHTLGYFRDAGTVSDGALAFAPLLVFGFGNDRCGLFCVREAARQSSELRCGACRTRGTEPADLYVALRDIGLLFGYPAYFATRPRLAFPLLFLLSLLLVRIFAAEPVYRLFLAVQKLPGRVLDTLFGLSEKRRKA